MQKGIQHSEFCLTFQGLFVALHPYSSTKFQNMSLFNCSSENCKASLTGTAAEEAFLYLINTKPVWKLKTVTF